MHFRACSYENGLNMLEIAYTTPNKTISKSPNQATDPWGNGTHLNLRAQDEGSW